MWTCQTLGAPHMQTMHHTCKLCTTHANYVSHMQTMHYICKLCITYANYVPHMQTMHHTHKLCTTHANYAPHTQTMHHTCKLCTTCTPALLDMPPPHQTCPALPRPCHTCPALSRCASPLLDMPLTSFHVAQHIPTRTDAPCDPPTCPNTSDVPLPFSTHHCHRTRGVAWTRGMCTVLRGEACRGQSAVHVRAWR